MDIEALAMEAHRIIREDLDYKLRSDHGIEVAPGFFILYNSVTGQSKTVLYHPESGFVFKYDYEGRANDASGHSLGFVEWEGIRYHVRLPEFYIFPVDFHYITAQEYVIGENCGCGCGGWCSHSRDVVEVSKCNDSHSGNWKITNGGEVVLFDFEGIRL